MFALIGFSSSDAAGCSTDAGGCSAIFNSDIGGISPSCGGFIDSGSFSVDTFSNIGITSNCDVELGVSDHAQCDFTGNNAYYDGCFQNSMEHENVSAHPNDIQVDSFQLTHPIPVMPSAPYFTTHGVVHGYLNKGTQSTYNQTNDKELMFLRSETAQLQIMLASSKADEKKNAAIRAKLWDLTTRMERKGNMTGQYNLGLRNCPNHVTAVSLRPQSAGVDMQKIHKVHRNGCIVAIIMVIIWASIIAVMLGVSLTVGKK